MQRPGTRTKHTWRTSVWVLLHGNLVVGTFDRLLLGILLNAKNLVQLGGVHLTTTYTLVKRPHNATRTRPHGNGPARGQSTRAQAGTARAFVRTCENRCVGGNSPVRLTAFPCQACHPHRNQTRRTGSRHQTLSCDVDNAGGLSKASLRRSEGCERTAHNSQRVAPGRPRDSDVLIEAEIERRSAPNQAGCQQRGSLVRRHSRESRRQS